MNSYLRLTNLIKHKLLSREQINRLTLITGSSLVVVGLVVILRQVIATVQDDLLVHRVVFHRRNGLDDLSFGHGIVEVIVGGGTTGNAAFGTHRHP